MMDIKRGEFTGEFFSEAGEPAWDFDKLTGETMFRCQCGAWSALPPDEWMIGQDAEHLGEVNPSVHHDEAEGGCGFHQHVKLLDYDPKEDLLRW